MSTLERLDELDALLRDVQAELMPEAGIPDPPPPPPVPDPAPPPPIPEPPPPPPPPPTPTPSPELDSSHDLKMLGELAAGLLASTRALLAGYERMLTPRAPATRPTGVDVFRQIEAAVSSLPGVRDVAVQAHEGSDRVIIDVRLDQPNP